jgi:GNAT superfamily N-acetyltransferase
MLQRTNTGEDKRDLPSVRICACGSEHFDAIRTVINDAAVAYRKTIPPQLYREPWMSVAYLAHELEDGVRFLGCYAQGNLLGVMGVQDRGEVTLIRHAYVRTAVRRTGIGSELIEAVKAAVEQPMLVGCLKAMTWAIAFYQKHDFHLVSDAERDRLRAMYWTLSQEHVQNSVVLADKRWLRTRNV